MWHYYEGVYNVRPMPARRRVAKKKALYLFCLYYSAQPSHNQIAWSVFAARAHVLA